MEETIVKRPPSLGSAACPSQPLRLGGGRGDGGNLNPSSSKERTGAARIKVGGDGDGGMRGRGWNGFAPGARGAAKTVVEFEERGTEQPQQPAAPQPQHQQQQQEPVVKKRRNLDWGKGRVGGSSGRGGGGSASAGSRRIELFVPQYESGARGDGGGKGARK